VSAKEKSPFRMTTPPRSNNSHCATLLMLQLPQGSLRLLQQSEEDIACFLNLYCFHHIAAA